MECCCFPEEGKDKFRYGGKLSILFIVVAVVGLPSFEDEQVLDVISRGQQSH